MININETIQVSQDFNWSWTLVTYLKDLKTAYIQVKFTDHGVEHLADFEFKEQESLSAVSVDTLLSGLAWYDKTKES